MTETADYLPNSLSNSPLIPLLQQQIKFEVEEEDDELKKLLQPDVSTLPLCPPSAVETNFVRYFALDFMKAGHDQYVYRHANGLCVIGLAKTHVALQAEGGVTSVDFNVGKSDRSELKVSGKRKKVKDLGRKHQKLSSRSLNKNAQHFQPNSILCNVHSGDVPYTVRCCVKGPLLEVNNKLIENPDLLNTSAEREGYIAIVMPRPGDWLKIKETLVDFDEFQKLRNLS